MSVRIPNANREYVDGMQRFLPNDKQSRHNWAVATASVMIHNWTLDQLHACVDGGKAKFYRYCRTYLHGHGFHTEDFDTMFAALSKAARMNPNRARDFVNKLVVEASR